MSQDGRTALDEFLLVARRRWRLVLMCVVLASAVALALTLRQPTQYTASASLLFRDPGFDQMLFGNASLQPATDNDPTRIAATNSYLISLPAIAARTGAALHLPSSVVTSDVSVTGAGQADVAQITATDASPVLAAEIANTYAQQYIAFRQQADRAKISGAQRLVQNELAALTPAQRYSSVGESLQKYADQLRILGALQTGNAEVAQPAGVVGSPSAPRTKRNALLGALLGLLLGMGITFVAERVDRRIREASELEEAFGAPVLAAVPMTKAIARAAVAPIPGADAEVFSLLRARLRYYNVEHDVRSVLVTSVSPHEGKTTLSLNLALAEAAAGNPNVVLVEADFRRPSLASRLGVEAAPGLGEILTRGVTLERVEAAAHRVTAPTHGDGEIAPASFTVITAGTPPLNPVELMEGRALVDLFVTLSERFDLIIIDGAPASVPDGLSLMKLVSGVLIVARMGVSKRDAARHLAKQLARLKVSTLGVVANAFPVTRADYYSSFGYRPDDAAQAPRNFSSHGGLGVPVSATTPRHAGVNGAVPATATDASGPAIDPEAEESDFDRTSNG